jgi:glycosyltransferase involved in cell wall biosynthesis
MIAAPVAFLAHLRAIRRFNPDLVWVNTVLVPMWILAGRALRRRVVVHDHEIVSGSVLVRRLAYAPLMLAHVVIVVSEAARADIAAVYPKLAARAVVLTNRSFEITTPVPVEDPASIDIVMMGRIDERKGQHILLEALNEMTFPNPAPTVHICGEPYPPGSAAAEQYHARLVRAAARAPIPVRMHGYVNRVEALRMGSIVVVPSTISEPWSLVVSEALTAGRAVVASDSGGVSEQLAGYGTLVPPNDPQALARALQTLLDDPARRAGEVQRALEWPRRFSLDDYFTHIAAIAFGQPG